MGDIASIWGIGLEQTVELLKHRCTLVHYDGPLDDDQLRAGCPKACLPIVRFLFVRFSELLAQHLEDHDHHFSDDMSDKELARGVINAWPLLSPKPQLGSLTAEKLVCPGRWGNDRILFVLQCLLVCSEKHHELNQSSAPFLQSCQIASLPFGQSDARCLFPAGKSDLSETQSTMQWMVDVYREQLMSVEPSVDGELEQAKWMAAVEASYTCLQSPDDDIPTLDDDSPILEAGERQAYRGQLLRAGLETATKSARPSDTEIAGKYASGMAALHLDGFDLADDDGFDDSRLNIPFIDAK